MASTLNLKKFISEYQDDTAQVGGVIYSGEPVDRSKGYVYRNYHDGAPQFEDNEPTSILSF